MNTKSEYVVVQIVLKLLGMIANILNDINFFVKYTRKGAKVIYGPDRFGEYQQAIDNVQQLDEITIEESNLPQFKLNVYTPARQTVDLPLIVFIHGGGWCVSDSSQFASYCKLLASNGYVVGNIDYSLSPEYQYPISTNQIIVAINYLLANSHGYKIDAANVFIAGNSAGAHLTSQLATIATNPDYAQNFDYKLDLDQQQLQGVVLINGIYNMETVADSKFTGMNQFLWAYTGQRDYLNYEKLGEMSPLKYINSNFPPAYITTGDKDSLNLQSREILTKLDAEKIKYTANLWDELKPGLTHDYVFNLTNKYSQLAFQEVITFLKENTIK